VRNKSKLAVVVVAVSVALTSLTGCNGSKQAVPQPTGTAAFYGSLEATKLPALKYMKPAAVVHLGELVCANLEAKRSVMAIIKDIVTLNGNDAGLNLLPKDRTKFAMGVIASSVSHLCPEQKEYVLSPHK